MTEIILICVIMLTAIVIGEMLFEWSSDEYFIVFRVKEMLFSSPLSELMSIAIGIGIGTMAVHLGKLWKPSLVFSTSALWALAICLFISIFLKSRLSIEPTLIDLYNNKIMVSILVGVFFTGKNYRR
ncbi:hypothetical protein H6G94_34290 [Nostoc punctiforme FACHB-252]|uniref:Uncharacterized protein n=1 Tax=Nostoc punctiforme FACHB-252 TaxID=1357509 RepID=A0ABR8HK64_NOSPU|nr:hypothetical protein [Nostoc punctiforme]MBD2616256.1 hypothetical protein [Nostoc punctiforme FACHB-252]